MPAKFLLEIPITQKLLSQYQGYQHQLANGVSQPFLNRHVADLLIFQEALRLGGLTAEYHFKIVPNLRREFALLKSGSLVTSPRLITNGMFADQFHQSAAIIKPGEFKKLIYGLSSNKALMSVTKIDELKKFSAVLVDGWVSDQNKLKKLGISNITTTYNYPSIFKLIKFRNIDFTLLDLPSSNDLSEGYEGIKLIPVPNIVITLDDSRHFIISKNHVDSELIRGALEKGIAILRKNGDIKKYYQQAKFLQSSI